MNGNLAQMTFVATAQVGTMDSVLHSLTYSLDYLRDQVADVPQEHMTDQAGNVINHPAWTIGHITVVLQNIGGVIGEWPWLSENFDALFGPGSVPSNDWRIYPSKDEALAALADAQDRIIRSVSSLSDAELDAPFPDPLYLDVFPTVRHALTQVLVGHTAFHVGQVSVWRRAMGRGSVGRSFE